MKLKETYIDSWFNKIKDQVELEESLIMEAKQVGDLYYCCEKLKDLLSILGNPTYEKQTIKPTVTIEVKVPTKGDIQPVDCLTSPKITVPRNYKTANINTLIQNNPNIWKKYLGQKISELISQKDSIPDSKQIERDIEVFKEKEAKWLAIKNELDQLSMFTPEYNAKRKEEIESGDDLLDFVEQTAGPVKYMETYKGMTVTPINNPKSRYYQISNILSEIETLEKFKNNAKVGSHTDFATVFGNDFVIDFIERVLPEYNTTSVSFSRSEGHTTRGRWSIGLVVDGNKLSERTSIEPFGHLGRHLSKYVMKEISCLPDRSMGHLAFLDYDSAKIPVAIYDDLQYIINHPDEFAAKFSALEARAKTDPESLTAGEKIVVSKKTAFLKNIETLSKVVINPYCYKDPKIPAAKKEELPEDPEELKQWWLNWEKKRKKDQEHHEKTRFTTTTPPSFKQKRSLFPETDRSSGSSFIFNKKNRVNADFGLSDDVKAISAEGELLSQNLVYAWRKFEGPSLEFFDWCAILLNPAALQSKIHNYLSQNSKTTSVGREEEERIWATADLDITGCVKGILLPAHYQEFMEHDFKELERLKLYSNDKKAYDKRKSDWEKRQDDRIEKYKEQQENAKSTLTKANPADEIFEDTATTWEQLFDLQDALSKIKYNNKNLHIYYVEDGHLVTNEVKQQIRDRRHISKEREVNAAFGTKG